jgi:hypothetical protein
MRSVMTLSRSGAVMFWCRREDFDEYFYDYNA